MEEKRDGLDEKWRLRDTCTHENVFSRGFSCVACGAYDGECEDCGVPMFDGGLGWQPAGEIIERGGGDM